VLACCYLLMLQLLHARPQFAGWGLRPETRMLVQGPHHIAVRLVGRPTHEIGRGTLASAHVDFAMTNVNDSRGLQVTRYLRGVLSGEYVLENPREEAIHVLWTLPFPDHRWNSSPTKGASVSFEGGRDGLATASDTAWEWSGILDPGERVSLALSYPLPALSELVYEGNASAADPLARLTIDGGDAPLVLLGVEPGQQEHERSAFTWQSSSAMTGGLGFRLRSGFSVFDALERLLQIAPLVTVMFLVTLLAVISRGRTPRGVEVCILSSAFAYYFPLVVYLNANFAMGWAVPIAFLASALVLLNYLRFLLGGRHGLLFGLALLSLYQVLPTMMAFAQWDRGLVLLSLGSVSLFAVVSLQTRRLKDSMAPGTAALIALCPLPLQDLDLRVSLPASLVPVARDEAGEEEPEPGELLMGIIDYDIEWSPTVIRVAATIPVESTGASPFQVGLLPPGTFLESMEAPDFLRCHVGHTGLLAHQTGAGRGAVVVRYLVAVTSNANDHAVTVPTVLGSVGSAELRASRSDLRFPDSPVWMKSSTEGATTWLLGFGAEPVNMNWKSTAEPEPDVESEPPGVAPPPLAGVMQVHALQVTDVVHLTVLESDGRVLHFARFELPSQTAPEALEVVLPAGFELESMTIDEAIIEQPVVRDGLCLAPLGERPQKPRTRVVSMRFKCARKEYGFRGRFDLELPRHAGTEGRVEWVVRPPRDFTLTPVGTGMRRASEIPEHPFGLFAIADPGRDEVALVDVLVPAGRIEVGFYYIQELRKLIIGGEL